MKSLDTLYFPWTDIYSIRQYPIFLLFPKIHILRPFEDKPQKAGEEPTDSFINSGLCQVHTPCPLGEDLDRFLHLVEDIRNRKDDYAAQLSSLTLAAMSTSTNNSERSKASIVSELLTPKDLQKDEIEQEKAARLWQARLVLAIGDLLDREEEDIAKHIAMLDDDQSNLFRELQGDETPEDDNPFEELGQIESNIGAARAGNIKNRFNSWKTLFQESELTKDIIWLTTSQDAGDQLIHQYENITGKPPILMTGLTLPALIDFEQEKAVESIHKFQSANSDLLATLQDLLGQLSKQAPVTKFETQDGTAVSEFTKRWNAALESTYPKQQFGRISVGFYMFPGHDCNELATGSIRETHTNGLLLVAD